MTRMLLALLLLLSSPAWATWGLVQHVMSAACTTTVATCNITVSSTGAGHVIGIGMMAGVPGETISSVSGGGTYTHPAGCAGSDSTGLKASDCAYTLASTSGTTTITVTRGSTSSAIWRCEAVELSFTGSSVSLDVVGNRDQSANSSAPAGVTLTLTGSNDTIIQFLEGTSPSSISAPYSTDFFDVGSSTAAAAAESRNTTSGTAPTWATGTGKAALSAIAFAEVGGAAVILNRALMGVGK